MKFLDDLNKLDEAVQARIHNFLDKVDKEFDKLEEEQAIKKELKKMNDPVEIERRERKEREIEIRKSDLLGETVEALIKMYKLNEVVVDTLSDLAKLEKNPQLMHLYMHHFTRFGDALVINDRLAKFLDNVQYSIETSEDTEE